MARRVRAFVVVMAWVCSAAVGQDSPKATVPPPTPETVAQELERQRPKAQPIQPATLPESTGQGLAGGRLNRDDKLLLWPEDYFLSGRRGWLRGEGLAEFAFAADDEGHTDPSIELLRNTKLRQMQTFLEGADYEVEFTLTGRVTEYYGKNYLLVRSVAMLRRPAPEAKPTTQPAVPAASTPPGTEGDGGSILDQLERDSQPVEPLPQASADDRSPPLPATRLSVAPAGRSEQSWPEDTRLANLVGRLVREADGWSFAFESDSDRPAEQAVDLLPNLALQRMEELSDGATQSMVFIVSADTTVYAGRNYLLVRRFAVRREDGNIQ